MKRIVGLLLVVAMLLGSVGAFATDIDIKALSDAELQELLSEIYQELGVILYPGMYVIGTDITPGSYIFTILDDNEIGVAIFAYKSREEYDEYRAHIGETKIWPDNYTISPLLNQKSTSGSFTEGQILKIEMAPVVITPRGPII